MPPIVPGNVPVSCWPIFSPVRSNSPRRLCEKISRFNFLLVFKIANRFSSSDAPSLSRTKSDLHKDPFGAGYIPTVGTR